jgi:hypothetical protein
MSIDNLSLLYPVINLASVSCKNDVNIKTSKKILKVLNSLYTQSLIREYSYIFKKRIICLKKTNILKMERWLRSARDEGFTVVRQLLKNIKSKEPQIPSSGKEPHGLTESHFKELENFNKNIIRFHKYKDLEISQIQARLNLDVSKHVLEGQKFRWQVLTDCLKGLGVLTTFTGCTVAFLSNYDIIEPKKDFQLLLGIPDTLIIQVKNDNSVISKNSITDID